MMHEINFYGIVQVKRCTQTLHIPDSGAVVGRSHLSQDIFAKRIPKQKD